MAVLGPFTQPANQIVDFRVGGDTTKEAFGKHIQAIERIYGILTSLDAQIRSTDYLDDAVDLIDTNLEKHILDTNPHPNYKPSLSFTDITGDLDASKVLGDLSRATIDVSRVKGLAGAISGQIPASTGDGITSKLFSGTGNVKFNNGLIIRWGNSGQIFRDGDIGTYTFPEKFSSQCFTVQLTYRRTTASDVLDDMWCQLISYDTTKFTCRIQADDNHVQDSKSQASVDYLAIGV